MNERNLETCLFLGIRNGVSKKGNTFHKLIFGRMFNDVKYGTGYYPLEVFLTESEYDDFKNITPTSVFNAELKSTSQEVDGKTFKNYVLCRYEFSD